ncbi:MAG: glycosyltransferase [bacterium]|nr:glycosyltransferase [bacterium]
MDSDKKTIHIVIHTHVCLPMLLPVMQKIMGNPLYSLTVTVKYKEAVNKIAKEGIRYSEEFDLFEKFLYLNSPRLLLTAADDVGNHHVIGRNCVIKAKEKGIPTIVMQHGGVIRHWAVSPPEYVITSDKMALWGEWFLEEYTTTGKITPEKGFIAGNPKFDNVIKGNWDKYGYRIKEILKLKRDEDFCLFAGENHGLKEFYKIREDKIVNILKSIFNVVMLNSPIKLIIKPHPEEFNYNTVKYYEKAIKDTGIDARIIYDKDISLYELLASAKYVITHESTVGLEALMLRTPVISIRTLEMGYSFNALSNDHTYFSIISVGNDMGIKMKSAIERITNTHLTKEDFESPLYRFLYKLDGKASERILQKADEFMNEVYSKKKQPISITGKKVVREKEKLKILQIAHNFLPYSCGGTELYTMYLAQGLKNKGHDVYVFYPHYSPDKQMYSIEEKEYRGLKLAEVNIKPQNLIENVNNETSKEIFRNYIKRHNFDIIHFQHIEKALSSSLLETASAVAPTILTLHGFWFICEQDLLCNSDGSACSGPDTIDKCIKCCYGNTEIMEQEEINRLRNYFAYRKDCLIRMIKYPDLVMAVSKFCKSKFREYDINKKISVARIGILKDFTPINGIPRKDKRIVFSYLGSLIPRKGCHILLEAWESIKNINSELNIYGIPADTEYSARMMEKISKLNNVSYKGSYVTDDLPDIFSQSDVVIAPSVGENYPTVIRESFHAKVPVIASKIAGVPEIVKDGVNGLIFEPGNIENLRSKIIQIIEAPLLISKFKKNIKPVRVLREDIERLEKTYKRLIVKRKQKAGMSQQRTLDNLQMKREIIEMRYIITDLNKKMLKFEKVHVSENIIQEKDKAIEELRADGRKIIQRELDTIAKFQAYISRLKELYEKQIKLLEEEIRKNKK